MSEYQYYEFRALDRPLERAEMDALRQISTRAEITSRSLTNEYHWGDFKGNPDRLMEKYFDVHLYFANWGTHQLMLRVPVKLLPLATAKQYAAEDALRAWATKDHVIFDFVSRSEDDFDWEEGEGGLDQILPVRDELLAGDLRALYLGWLATLDEGDEEIDDEALEPPVPPGLNDLTDAQEAFAKFLRVDAHLLKVAATASPASAAAGPSKAELKAWVAKLPDREKNEVLAQFMETDGATARVELLARFREDTKRKGRANESSAVPRRTVGELLAARDERAVKERLAAAEKKARDDARRLDALAGKEESLWAKVETAIGTKLPQEYDKAIGLLKDLRDLAVRAKATTAFAERVAVLRAAHQRKSSFVQRLDKAALTSKQ